MSNKPGKVNRIVRVRMPEWDSPAKSDVDNGIIYINLPVFNKLPRDTRKMVILHEEGHIVENNPYDEIQADAYAFYQYAKRGNSLKGALKALTRVLDPDNPEHAARMKAMYARARVYDREVNNNKRIKPMNHVHAAHKYLNNPHTANSSFLGIDVKGTIDWVGNEIKESVDNRQERKKERQYRKTIKQESKATLREGKAVGRASGGDESFASGALGSVNNFANQVNTLLAGMAGNALNEQYGTGFEQSPGQGQIGQPMASQAPQSGGMDKTTLWIIAGAVILVIIGIIIFFATRSNS